jgi:Ohr subfamily peroxiredoxin
MIKPLYTAHATATGGRNGNVKSSDDILALEIRSPKELGGSGGATNPEQLFAAGYAACFDSALNLVMRQARIKTGMTSVTAAVTLGSLESGGYGLAAELQVNIPGVDEATAQQLVEQAHQVCPYSNATRNNIAVTLNVTTHD